MASRTTDLFLSVTRFQDVLHPLVLFNLGLLLAPSTGTIWLGTFDATLLLVLPKAEYPGGGSTTASSASSFSKLKDWKRC